MKLAIIIPSFKGLYLDQTLKSLQEQTDKRFRVYIGDDASKEDLKSIVEEYCNDLDIIYYRFEKNLGGKDLVAHWHRCIELVQEEDWIWLFSDDDILDSNCVEYFYNSLELNVNTKLFHFNVNIIDKDNNIIQNAIHYREVLSAQEFVEAKLRGRLSSFVVEYVINKEEFWKQGGFVNFDLAWNADDATWYKLGKVAGIQTIAGAFVNWRSSGINISRIEKNALVAKRKLHADISFSTWLLDHMSLGIKDSFVFKLRLYLWLLIRIYPQKELLQKEDFIQIVKKFHKEVCAIWLCWPVYLYYHLFKSKTI